MLKSYLLPTRHSTLAGMSALLLTLLSASLPMKALAADRVWSNPAAASLTLTADAATAATGAYYVSAGTALAVGDALVADTAAAGLAQNTVYYVVGVLTDGVNYTNVLSATSGGVALTNTATDGQTVTCTAAAVWAANWDTVPGVDDNAFFLTGYSGKAVNLREAATVGSLNFNASGSELNLLSTTNGTSSLSPLVFSTTSGTPAITNWTANVMRLGMEDATYHNGTLKINGTQGLLFDGMNASGALRLEKIDWSGFSGDITVQEGLIDLFYNNALIGTTGSTAQNVTLGNGASANVSGLKVQNSQAVNALNGTETARVFGGGTLTVGYNNGSGVYNGQIGVDMAGASNGVSFTKLGNGTQVVSSNMNVTVLNVGNGTLVIGGGVVTNSSYLDAGYVANSTNATLIVTNTTVWANPSGLDSFVGAYANGISGSLMKFGQGSYWDLGNRSFRVAAGGSMLQTNNTLLITDGAIMTNCQRIFIADNSAHAGNKVIVSNNAVVYLNQAIYVGQASRTVTNQLYIMNGGQVYANRTSTADAGMGNAGYGSLTMISGAGSLLDFNGKQYKCGGNVGTNNTLLVINGGVLTNTWGPYVGDNGAAVGNRMIVSNGAAYYGAINSSINAGGGGGSYSNYLQIGGLGAPSVAYAQKLYCATAAGANSNTVVITNASFGLYASGGCSVGNEGTGNLGTNNALIVQQGGLLDISGYFIRITASATNSIIVDGGVITNIGSMIISDKSGNGNQMVVKKGGKVYHLNNGGYIYMANSISQLNPSATLTDSGSLWDCAGYTFNVGKKSDGSNMTNHTLTVANSAVLTNCSVLVSAGGTSLNNKLVVNGGKVYANTLTVNAGGTVQLTGGSSDLLQVDTITGAGSLVVTGAAVTASSVVVGWTNGSSTLGPKLTGNLALTKVGTGNLTFSGAENYSGATKVNEGSVTVPPAYAGNSAFTIAAGATLIPSTSTSSNSALMASLALDNGSTLIFASLPVNTNAPVTAGVLAPTNTVTITASGAYAVGTYDLIKYTTLGGDGVGAFALTPRPGVTAYVTNNTATTPKKIQLVITAVTPEIWKGQVSTNWDIAITQNWQTNGVDAFYFDLSAVQFDDSRVNVSPLVNLTANVQASAVTVSNVTKDYVLATENSSAMSGLGGLTKKGSGTLTIANMNNTFSGNVAIDAGNVILASATLGSGSIANNGGLTFNGNQTLLNTISGTGSVTNNSGTTTLGANNSYSGGTTLNGGSIVLNSGTTNGFGSGVVRLNNNASIAVKPANIAGGSWWNSYNSVYIGNSLVVQAGQTNVIENTGSLNFGNLWLGGTNYGGYPNWTGSGTLKFQNNSPTAVITAVLWMGNILQNFNGTIELGTTVPGNRILNLMGHTGIDGAGGAFGVGPFAVTNFNAAQTAWVLDGDGTGYTDNRANDWVSVCQLGSISAIQSVTGLQGAKSNATEFVIGALNTDTVYAGFISNNAAGGLTSLTKVGTGKLTLSGFGNGYTGSTIVSNGTLVISGSQGGMFGLGAGDFTVAGGKLEITGSLMVSNAVNVNSGTLSGIGTITGSVTNFGGTIYPGLDGTGTLYFNNSLTFAAPAMTKIVVADGVVSNFVSVGGMLSPNGSTVLIDTAGQVLNDSTNTIMSYSGGNNATTFNLSFVTPQTGKAVSLVDSGSTIDLVVTTSSAPTPEPISVNYDSNTGQLTLTWTQPGWTLEAQTNSLSTGLSPSGWSTVSGAASPYVITVSPTAPTVFYRLKY